MTVNPPWRQKPLITITAFALRFKGCLPSDFCFSSRHMLSVFFFLWPLFLAVDTFTYLFL